MKYVLRIYQQTCFYLDAAAPLMPRSSAAGCAAAVSLELLYYFLNKFKQVTIHFVSIFAHYQFIMRKMQV